MNKVDRIIELLESIDSKLSLTKKKVTKKKEVGEDNPTLELWAAYSNFFMIRYKVDPQRNGMINGMLANICKRVAREDLMALAEFFIRQNDAWYLREMHHVRCLAKDCEILLTRMKSKVVMTASKAREVERISDNLNEVSQYLENKRSSNESNT